jgi:1,4-alpha-glucan branching enzyme
MPEQGPSIPDGTGLIKHDPWLGPYADSLRHRYSRYSRVRREIEAAEGPLTSFAGGYQRFGFTRGAVNGQSGTWYREWAPGAASLSLIGEFNGWSEVSHVMTRDHFGVFSVFVPDRPDGELVLPQGAAVKVRVFSNGAASDRIPAYIRRVEFDADGGNARGIVWYSTPYAWKHPAPARPAAPRIYEAHVGMSMEKGGIASFEEFRSHVLPRIAKGGYNTIQLMAIQEHPYYGSFGYHVSNFFAVSSRFGTPEDFRRLVDEAHGLGLRVIIDLVHSHSVKNTVEGLNRFDGTDHQYFHAGVRGEHAAWDSLLFNYGAWEVQRFLLSNVRYWLEEYNVDGFRFDGVTSMMYLHHGLGQSFNSYDDYLRNGIDEDAVTYLQLANEVAHALRPDCSTVAEDVSGMVGLCRPVNEGGIGFDYRLAMGLPDYWISMLRDVRDEDWRMSEMFRTMTNRRPMEAHIGYCESHDQALVGDKTVAFWLMDKEMYWHMDKAGHHPVIDRGIALHKMIRLMTFAAGGEGYLNFMGNEFGHPEWIDFPRAGNGWSFHYCRRQWSLVDNPALRYAGLSEFDRAMQALDTEFGLLTSGGAEWIGEHEEHKLIMFRRAGLVFAFNWHPVRSEAALRIPVGPKGERWKVVMSSDDVSAGGFGTAPHGQEYSVLADVGGSYISLHLPARTAVVLRDVSDKVR